MEPKSVEIEYKVWEKGVRVHRDLQEQITELRKIIKTHEKTISDLQEELKKQQ